MGRSTTAFQGLVEPFDLALGLRVVGVSVVLGDAEDGQKVFEGVLAVAETGGVDESVVGQNGCRWPVFVDVGGEGINYQCTGDESWAVHDSRSWEWSSSQLKISTSVPWPGHPSST